MKLFCTQENLKNGLFITSHITNKNVNLPVLNNILLKGEKEKNVLRISSTNLEIGIHTFIRAKIEREGEFTIPSKTFSDLVNFIGNEKIDLELKENNFLEIKTKNFQAKIKGIEASEFPLIPEIEKKEPYILNNKEFTEAISQVIFAVSENETRQEISGVFLRFDPKKGKAFLVGTDSYRLAEKKINLLKNSSSKEVSVIVPLKTMHELLRILQGVQRMGKKEDFISLSKNNEIKIYLSENQILFVFNNIELISRLIEGHFPNYEQIIPEKFNSEVVLSVEELIKGVKTVSLFSKSGIFDITFDFLPSKNKVEISASNIQLGEGKISLEGKLEGIKNSIVLNYRYLLEGLLNLKDENLVMKIIDDSNPCLLFPEKKGLKENYLYIIMPIKQ